MIYLLIALQLADIATTHYALKSGIGTEGNPVLRKLFDRFGHEPVLLAIKGAFIAGVWVWQDYIHPYAIAALVVLYLAVVGNNLKVILSHKRSS